MIELEKKEINTLLRYLESFDVLKLVRLEFYKNEAPHNLLHRQIEIVQNLLNQNDKL